MSTSKGFLDTIVDRLESDLAYCLEQEASIIQDIDAITVELAGIDVQILALNAQIHRLQAMKEEFPGLAIFIDPVIFNLRSTINPLSDLAGKFRKEIKKIDDRPLIEQTIKELREEIAILKKKDHGALTVRFFTIIQGQKKEISKMFLKLNQSLPMSIEIQDKFGNPAQVDGVPAWALTDPSLGDLVVAADGMSASFSWNVANAKSDSSLKVQVSADADLGPDQKSILGELQLDAQAAEAAVIAIKPGAPIDA